ncbi:MAG: glycosyltransferase family 2 protein [Cytophagales bacterium]|jgi:glycosyltransferase involved in cell wall biosynthesis|nr:glycosyltransferase family 2 protein [Cytophagales bacterium]
MPKLSIITITYLAEAYLERTFKSVFEQGFADEIDYIVVDGASKDRTLEIIEAHKSKVNQFISEKDKGIYDAMNKGMQLAKGDYILFLNAGDTFASPDTLKNLLQELAKNPDVLYGEAVFVNKEGQHLGLRSEVTPHRLPVNLTWRDFKFGMLVCHQAFIAKRSISPLFDLQYKLSSDIDWEIKVLKKSSSIIKSEKPICNYLMGGASVQNLKQSWEERYLVLKSHFGGVSNLLNHVNIILRGLIFAFKNQGKYW